MASKGKPGSNSALPRRKGIEKQRSVNDEERVGTVVKSLLSVIEGAKDASLASFAFSRLGVENGSEAKAVMQFQLRKVIPARLDSLVLKRIYGQNRDDGNGNQWRVVPLSQSQGIRRPLILTEEPWRNGKNRLLGGKRTENMKTVVNPECAKDFEIANVSQTMEVEQRHFSHNPQPLEDTTLEDYPPASEIIGILSQISLTGDVPELIDQDYPSAGEVLENYPPASEILEIISQLCSNTDHLS